MKYSLAALALCLTAFQAHSQSPVTDEATFSQCLSGLQTQARQAGVNEKIVADVVPSLKRQERALSNDRKQAEFVQTFQKYLDARVTAARIEQGRKMLQQHHEFLLELQARYGVPPQYLLAFWGLETNFGSYMGNMSTLDSLATMACDQRRSAFFSTEFVAALQLLERESLLPENMKGSWAGAVGHTQFMPTTYLSYAVDGDGDGRIDLWSSERDALASGANYLQALGWDAGVRWGREVQLGSEYNFEWLGRNTQKPLAEWAAKGLKRADGAALPVADIDAALVLPSGHQGPAFLVYDNFSIIMQWNRSELYAISVGHLADRIKGAGPLLGNTSIEPLRTEDIVTAQRALNILGYDAGPDDGVLGSGTRAALQAFQRDNTLVADGYLDTATLLKLTALSTR